VTAKSSYDTAYFTWLRAIEERDALWAYREYLADERRRLDEFATATSDGGHPIPPKIRRAVDATAKPVLDAIEARQKVVDNEALRVEERIANAEAFVAECETEVVALRG
jgi:hypothetical protein